MVSLRHLYHLFAFSSSFPLVSSLAAEAELSTLVLENAGNSASVPDMDMVFTPTIKLFFFFFAEHRLFIVVIKTVADLPAAKLL